VKIQQTGYFMIHDPLVVFFLAALNISDLTRLADSLQAVKEGIVNAYETKTGLSRTRLSKLMTDEIWMDAKKAADLGFVDEIVGTEKKVLDLPKNTAIVNALGFGNLPPALLQAMQTENVAPVAAASEPLLTEDMQREAQTLREQVEKILRKEKEDA
jgi:ATP-dependent Clp protease protease subunit